MSRSDAAGGGGTPSWPPPPTRAQTPAPSGPGPGPACRADFPGHLFTIDAHPTAMRASAQEYRAVAARAAEWDSGVTQANAASWVGAEGDTYRRGRAAYHPMLRAAQEAFTGLAREVDRCATEIEYAIRRMDVVRPAAEDAWRRLQAARDAAATRLASLDQESGTRLFSALGDPPEVAGLRRTYDLLAEEATTLRRRVEEAATEAAAAIGRLGPPAAVPQPGGDPYGPTVVSRDTYEVSTHGQFEAVVAGVSYVVVWEKLSDGGIRTKVTEAAEAGVGGTWTPFKLKVGGENVAGLPEVTGEATTGSRMEAVFYADSEEEAWAQAARALGTLAAHQGRPSAWSAMGSHATAVTVEIDVQAGVTSDMAKKARDLVPVTGWDDVGKAEISGQVHGEMREERGVDGSQESSLSFSAAGTIEYPMAKEGALVQETHEVSAETTATVRTAANGAAVLVVTAALKGPGQSNSPERRWARILTPKEAASLRTGMKEWASGSAARHPTREAAETVVLLEKTTSLDESSPEVVNGTVDYSERTWEEETRANPGITGQILGIEAGGEVEARTEKATPVPRSSP